MSEPYLEGSNGGGRGDGIEAPPNRGEEGGDFEGPDEGEEIVAVVASNRDSNITLFKICLEYVHPGNGVEASIYKEVSEGDRVYEAVSDLAVKLCEHLGETIWDPRNV